MISHYTHHGISPTLFMISSQGGKILTGMLVLFFGFEIWPNPIFLGWQIFQLFFWVSQNLRYFFGSDKFPSYFLGLPIFVSHTGNL